MGNGGCAPPGLSPSVLISLSPSHGCCSNTERASCGCFAQGWLDLQV